MTSKEKQLLSDNLKKIIAEEWKNVFGQSNAEIMEAVKYWTHQVNNVNRNEYTLAMLDVYQEEEDIRTGVIRGCHDCGASIGECDGNCTALPNELDDESEFI